MPLIEKAEGKIIFQTQDKKLEAPLLLEIEHTLNSEIAALIYERFNVGIRVHIGEG